MKTVESLAVSDALTARIVDQMAPKPFAYYVGTAAEESYRLRVSRVLELLPVLLAEDSPEGRELRHLLGLADAMSATVDETDTIVPAPLTYPRPSGCHVGCVDVTTDIRVHIGEESGMVRVDCNRCSTIVADFPDEDDTGRAVMIGLGHAGVCRG